MSLAAEMLWSLWISMVLIPAHSHKASPGLVCTNDFVNNVSCSWTGAGLGSAENCSISGNKIFWFNRDKTLKMKSCKLKQHGNSSLGCSFVFENTKFSGYDVMPGIYLICNGTQVETITNYKPGEHIKMHPPGAPGINITANSTVISWSLGDPVSMYFTSGFDFQLQIKQRQQQWKDSRNISTREQELRTEAGKLKGRLDVRVRVNPVGRPGSHWSDWSPTTSWEDLKGEKSHSHSPSDQNTVRWSLFSLGLFLVTVIVVLAHYKTRGLLKGKPLPNPSEYFQTLHTVHQGNLKEWLNPFSGTQSFLVTPSCDQISHVVVCEDWNEAVSSSSPTSIATSPLLHFHRYPTSCSNNNGLIYNSSSLSSFSNVGYFMSSSSGGGSARTDSNPAYFAYQDNFQNAPHIHGLHFPLCDPLASYPEYESLKREPESPDSGFGIMKEDEMKETWRVISREGEEALNDHSSPLFFLPLHLPSRPPSSPSAHPSTLTQPSESQQMEVAETDTGSSSAAQPVAGAMCRSSSMPVEPFRTGYLTLKELQMTFSNKSI
ncbi:interleukin-2 receptor subunit beta isoform X1 [Poecilia latipinna]|uniref:interleukin-2 receptor subunit beta isoform X1 n=1 Tax=Poecilia latipinna TaxID=48699 RepID=UPI00072ECBAC|nr:PREDICTED: interleukin-2 receptor subunit beta-like isoform X1 [Poecilia latipinna]